jgi:pimeloyl-ACP methyl ester carboxylesterase/predicted glycosyltransferase
MRAREPDRSGHVDRDGVRIAYEVHGTAGPVILFVPAWAISHSRLWKGQVATFARHHRVVTYDPRGNGESDRPRDPPAYSVKEYVADAVAVLDAVGAARAIVVGNSFGSIVTYLLSALFPDRVEAAVHVGTTLDLVGDGEAPLAQALEQFDAPWGGDQGWQRYRYGYWQRDFPGFVEFFVRQAMSEPHSTKLIEDGIAWGRSTDADTLAHTVRFRGNKTAAEQRAWLASLAAKIRCQSLVIHGEADAVAPADWGRELARILDVRPEIWERAGHCPQARHPARFNRRLQTFIDEVTCRQRATPRVHRPRSRRRRPRVLYLSSPIGLGHVRRDLAIVEALRRRVPDVELEWLAQDPVTRFLHARGEHVHPASAVLANESAHLESEAGEHDLNVFEALRRMDEILVANYSVFAEVVEQGNYDLVVGDEAWEVDHFWHEAPEQKRTRFAWLTDFVGYLPMPAGGDRERMLTADYNAEMLEHVERHPEIRDAAIFVGNRKDVVDIPFGPGLPSIRQWTAEHYEFSGYVSGFEPASLPDRRTLRESLGYEPGEPVIVSAVGGSGVGTGLLRRVIEAHHRVREAIPEVRTVLVTGPRIDPHVLPDAPGLDKRAFLPDLPRHLAASDLAVVQGGLSTTMELTACRRPFLYVPLLNHFEQQIHVRHRLENYRAGRAVDFTTTSADDLAGLVLDTMASTDASDVRPVETDGADEVARRLCRLL